MNAGDVAKAIERGAEALFRRQRPDGVFGDDPPASILGTAGTVAALHAADPVANADLVGGGVAWLRAQQHGDGGWGGVVGADSEVVATAIALSALRMCAPAETAAEVEAGRARLAALGGVPTVEDRAVKLMCAQFLTMAGLTEDAGPLRRIPLEIVHFDKVRRRMISFRTAPFVGLALMQADLLPAGKLRQRTLRKARVVGLSLLRSIYDHEGRTGALSEDPWPAALVLLGLARAGEAPDMADAIADWLRRAVRPDGSWDAVANLDLTRSGYAVTGLAAAGYRDDPRLAPTRAFFHATRKTQAFDVLDVPPGGWSYSNLGGWPVTLESAEILSALAGYAGAGADRELAGGVEWLLGRQDRRGSWSLWVKDTRLPNDGPCPAITSQAVCALLDSGRGPADPAVARAADWLLTRQKPDGTFENLWYRDHTSGTAVVVAALARAGRSGHEVVRRSVRWLVDTQLADGSWGPGDGTAGSVEETGWAVQGLLAAGGDRAAVARGVEWLVAAAQEDGSWERTRVCNYIRHYMRYPNGVITQAVALRALGEYLEAEGEELPGAPAKEARGERAVVADTAAAEPADTASSGDDLPAGDDSAVAGSAGAAGSDGAMRAEAGSADGAAPSASFDVIVVGAGAGGLAAARALGALDLRVLVLDRQRGASPLPKGEILQPESVRILDDWGALAALQARGAVPVSRLAIRDPAGDPLLALDYGVLPGRYREIMCADYADLQEALLDGIAPGVEVRRGVRVTDALRDAAGRVVGVRVAGGGELRATLVVAADGMSSPLRKAVGLEAERREYPHRLMAFDVADANVTDEVSAYRTGRGLCLVYPLPGGRCRLYVQALPDEFRAAGTADLTAWCDRLLAEVPAIRPLEKAIRASLDRRQLLAVHRLRAERFSAPGLALVGESAHAVHPMAAQGVNSSLSDAETLAALLGAETAGGGFAAAAVDRALTAYDAARGPRIDHIAVVSHNASRMITEVSGLPKLLGARMMRRTAANPRLLARTAGNMSGTDVRPLTFVDRLFQLGVLVDRKAHVVPVAGPAPASTAAN